MDIYWSGWCGRWKVGQTWGSSDAPLLFRAANRSAGQGEFRGLNSWCGPRLCINTCQIYCNYRTHTHARMVNIMCLTSCVYVDDVHVCVLRAHIFKSRRRRTIEGIISRNRRSGVVCASRICNWRRLRRDISRERREMSSSYTPSAALSLWNSRKTLWWCDVCMKWGIWSINIDIIQRNCDERHLKDFPYFFSALFPLSLFWKKKIFVIKWVRILRMTLLMILISRVKRDSQRV